MNSGRAGVTDASVMRRPWLRWRKFSEINWRFFANVCLDFTAGLCDSETDRLVGVLLRKSAVKVAINKTPIKHTTGQPESSGADIGPFGSGQCENAD